MTAESEKQPAATQETNTAPEAKPSPEAAAPPQAGAAQQPAAEEAAANPQFVPSPEAKIEQLEAELKKAKDDALRHQAELENFRKRKQREMEEERRYTILPFARDLLAVVDNLDRALEAAATAQDNTALQEGVKMVATQLQQVLSTHQCVRIPAVGTQFDPNFHEAIGQEASTEHPAGVVTRELVAGYKLHDRVVRPSQVFVSTGAP